MKLLINPPIGTEAVADLQAVVPGVDITNAQTDADAEEVIRDADAMYGGIMPTLLSTAKRLLWVQAPWSGLDHYMFPALIESDVTLTNMRGIYGDHIADLAMAYVLMFARGLHIHLRRQLEGKWGGGAPIVHLADQTLGIIGLGGIGTEVAPRGIVVDLAALTNGALAGAGLDVFEIEPLPAGHPLWGLDNVIITPHTGGGGLRSEERRMEVLKDNLRRFASGDPLCNVVDKQRWC